MKKALLMIGIGFIAIFALCSFSPVLAQDGGTPVPEVVPTEPEEPREPTVVEENIPDILQQLLVIFSIPAFGVLLGNLAKYVPFMKWMDGKTDKVVAVLVTITFGFAVYLKLFDKELFATLMPWLAYNFEKYVGYANVIVGWVVAIASIPWFHKELKGNFVVGRSFVEPKT